MDWGRQWHRGLVEPPCLPSSLAKESFSQSIRQALADSGAEGNFMNSNFALNLKVPLDPLKLPISVPALDGQPPVNGKVIHATSSIRLHFKAH